MELARFICLLLWSKCTTDGNVVDVPSGLGEIPGRQFHVKIADSTLLRSLSV